MIRNQTISSHDVDRVLKLVKEELFSGVEKNGNFNSGHEMYGVIREELEEFFDSVRDNGADPLELIQVASTAARGALELLLKQNGGSFD